MKCASRCSPGVRHRCLRPASVISGDIDRGAGGGYRRSGTGGQQKRNAAWRRPSPLLLRSDRPQPAGWLNRGHEPRSKIESASPFGTTSCTVSAARYRRTLAPDSASARSPEAVPPLGSSFCVHRETRYALVPEEHVAAPDGHRIDLAVGRESVDRYSSPRTTADRPTEVLQAKTNATNSTSYTVRRARCAGCR